MKLWDAEEKQKLDLPEGCIYRVKGGAITDARESRTDCAKRDLEDFRVATNKKETENATNEECWTLGNQGPFKRKKRCR